MADFIMSVHVVGDQSSYPFVVIVDVVQYVVRDMQSPGEGA